MAYRLSRLLSFRNIHSEVIKPGLGFVVLAKNASKTVAGAVFFYTATTAVFKFAASDERYSHLRPNNLVMWRAIQELSRRDIGILHLGQNLARRRRTQAFQVGLGSSRRANQLLSLRCPGESLDYYNG